MNQKRAIDEILRKVNERNLPTDEMKKGGEKAKDLLSVWVVELWPL